MGIYAMIVFSIGVGVCIYGIISKIIDMTAKKTIEAYIKNKSSHRPA
jgi:hypothetical protein